MRQHKHLTTYKETMEYLEDISSTGSILGLANIERLMTVLGNPQDQLSFIHIAGTNGKGSILAFTTRILTCAGYKAGTYLSPTVMGYLERYQINGQWMREEELPSLADQVKKAAEQVYETYGTYPTVFEVETAIAWLYFKEQGCDYVVLETGMGGATDSTNIVKTTKVCAFASISMDHMGFLGNTLEEIATVKSGILKSGAAAVLGFQKPEALKVLKERAEELGCQVMIPSKEEILREKVSLGGQSFSYKDYKHMELSVMGSYQPENAVTAILIAEALQKSGAKIKEEQIREGLKTMTWPGRFEIVKEDPLVIIDGAHNEDAARRLRESLDSFLPDRKIIAVLGVFKDKEYEKMARILGDRFEKVHTMELPNKARTLQAKDLKETYQQIWKELPVEAETSMEEAVDKAIEEAGKIDGVVLVSGSLSYLGETKTYISKGKANAI